jgi:hypothetical protein
MVGEEDGALRDFEFPRKEVLEARFANGVVKLALKLHRLSRLLFEPGGRSRRGGSVIERCGGHKGQIGSREGQVYLKLAADQEAPA